MSKKNAKDPSVRNISMENSNRRTLHEVNILKNLGTSFTNGIWNIETPVL